MLFQDQRDSFGMAEGDVIYYSGTFVVNQAKRIVGSMIGIKKTTGQIHYRVAYHTHNDKPSIKKEDTLDPIEFEKYLVNFDSIIQNNIRNGELIEFYYRFRPLDDPFTAHLDEEDQEMLHQIFLMEIAKKRTRNEAYAKIDQLMKQKVHEHMLTN